MFTNKQGLILGYSRRPLRLFPLRVSSVAWDVNIGADITHSLHHTKLPDYMREMKKYHLAHHYKNFDLGFGVTSKIWDYIFQTVLPV